MYKNFLKRVLDFFMSLLGIVVLSPIFLILAIIIKLTSPGPILFKQKRVGKNKSHFNILKFRTMRTDTPKDCPTHLLSNPDQYITKIGKFMRKTSLDELPQLFNILKGDMSIVGNRPLPLYEAELLTSDEHIDRFMGPAGLTGLWQVEKRGEAGKLSAEERKQLDIKYAKTFSFWLDIKIILKTVTAFIQKENV